MLSQSQLAKQKNSDAKDRISKAGNNQDRTIKNTLEVIGLLIRPPRTLRSGYDKTKIISNYNPKPILY